MSVPAITVYKKMMFFIVVVLVFSSCGIEFRERSEEEPDKYAVIELFQQSDFRNEVDRRNYLQAVKKYMDISYTAGYSSDRIPHWLYLQLEVLQRFQIEYITYD